MKIGRTFTQLRIAADFVQQEMSEPLPDVPTTYHMEDGQVRYLVLEGKDLDTGVNYSIVVYLNDEDL